MEGGVISLCLDSMLTLSVIGNAEVRQISVLSSIILVQNECLGLLIFEHTSFNLKYCKELKDSTQS